MQKNNKRKIFIVKVIIAILTIIVISLIYCKFAIENSKVDFYINGSNEVAVEYGSNYNDSGCRAILNKNDISKKVQVTSNVNTNSLGDYDVIYNLNIKLLGIDKTLIRKVHVIDTVKPVITIDCDKEFNIDKYSNFEIPKYTIVDNVDGDITSLAVVSSNLNTNKEGDYEIKITSTDSSNNVSEEKIKVHVEPKYKNAYINISITNQSLEYYERGNLVLSSPIVTGYNNSTPIGNFKVLNKSRNVHLRGADYVSFVNYWIAFKGYSYGFHDASWRNNFGGTIYKTNGSHGCVNMPYNKVQQLYNLVEVGTPVYIKY